MPILAHQPLTRRVLLWTATAAGAAAIAVSGWSITDTLAATHPVARAVASQTSAPATAPSSATSPSAGAAAPTAPTPSPVGDGGGDD